MMMRRPITKKQKQDDEDNANAGPPYHHPHLNGRNNSSLLSSKMSTVLAILIGIGTTIFGVLPFYSIIVLQNDTTDMYIDMNNNNTTTTTASRSRTRTSPISVRSTVMDMMNINMIDSNKNTKTKFMNSNQTTITITTTTTSTNKEGKKGSSIDDKTNSTNSISSSRSVNGTVTVAIPYINYEPYESPLDLFHVLKEKMDYAAQHGYGDDPTNKNNTVGQYLLDFAILGFPKAGTTTMMRWLNRHPELGVLQYEIMSLQKHHPARLLHYIIRDLPEGRLRRGYKSPNDIEDGRVRNKLGIHYPHTKVIVGIRHPVWWYESFYNHRIQNGYPMPVLTNTQLTNRTSSSYQGSHSRLRYTCAGMFNGVCFSRARFHHALAKWGKTALSNQNQNNTNENNDTDTDEWNYFTNQEQKSLRKERPNVSPNPIFIYDVNQLRMPSIITTTTTTTSTNGSHGEEDDQQQQQQQQQQYYHDFVLSLQEFLNITQDVSHMPEMIQESPGKTNLTDTEQGRRTNLKMDICGDDDDYSMIRQWLLESGQQTYEWISRYFIQDSPFQDVYVGGGNSVNGATDTSQFLKHVELYGTDPCPERRQQRQKKRERAVT